MTLRSAYATQVSTIPGYEPWAWQGEDLDYIERAVRRGAKAQLLPESFFLAWHSVATLAFGGFPSALLDVKDSIDGLGNRLAPENPGSRWPKVTFGALGDGRTLEKRDARCIREIAREFQPTIRSLGPTEIGTLSFVTFGCRSLERRWLTYPLPLQSEPKSGDAPPSEHASEVQHVLSAFEDLDSYLKYLQRTGRGVSHSRFPHTESTLVADIDPDGALSRCIDEFTAAVDQELPGFYSWFDRDSRHITVRALALLEPNSNAAA